MATSFFRQYPKIEYRINDNGSSSLVTDISRSVAVNSDVVPDDISSYQYYEIADGDRPDIISHKLYNDINYYWTFFMLNPNLKDGLNASWPLSNNELSRMVEREYSKYSAISFIPQSNINGTSLIDFSLAPLDDEYLPYLKLVLLDGSAQAQILRYDASMHQCIIYNITNSSGTSINRETFVKSLANNYRINWDDSIIVQLDDSDTPEILSNRAASAKRKWLDAAYLNLIKYDNIGAATIDSYEYDESLTPQQITDIKQQLKDSYILNKVLIPANNFFRWNYYYDAAQQYINDFRTVSAYDVLSNPNVVFYNYTSYIEHETMINDSKRKIKVIKQKFIRRFSDEYYEILNS
jgi:hypothetical protein